MHKHFLRPVKSKHTKRTLYFECEICCDDFRKMFTKLRNPRHQRGFISRFKQGGSLKLDWVGR